jgi:anti-anti-sigma regulatory factor
MFPPVVFLIWLIYRDVTTPIAEIEPSDLVGGENALQLPAAMAVFHVRKEKDHRGEVHRMPNLQAWAERLPATTRVVVLDLGEKSTFDSNAVMELRAVLKSFATQDRRLLIAGLGFEQFQQIRRMDSTEFLDLTNFCPDLELAIARAMTLAEDLPARATLDAPLVPGR